MVGQPNMAVRIDTSEYEKAYRGCVPRGSARWRLEVAGEVFTQWGSYRAVVDMARRLAVSRGAAVVRVLPHED